MSMHVTRRRFLEWGGRLGAGVGALAIPVRARAQIEDLLDTGRQLLEGVVDPTLIESLERGDRNLWEAWLKVAAAEMQGEHVLDLAALQDTAGVVLPLLDQSPETRGYASWLRARMDYFKVADFFQHHLPQPKPVPNRPAPRPITPTPEQERRAWKKQVEQQPQSKGAATWVPRLKPVFRGAGVPPELVWLAEVESSFDPQARSPVGAAGLYQLMPGTAQDLGLKTSPQDERLMPEKNARAAATYLGRLRRQFGDWALALAAYNAGPGRVAETLKRRRASSFDAIAPHLPAETQMYVPKFEAVLQRRERMTFKELRGPRQA